MNPIHSPERRYRVGIVGAGTMGKGLVELFGTNESIQTIAWKSRNLNTAKNAFSQVCARWEKLGEKHKLDLDTIAKAKSKISLVDNYNELSGLDCIIEAVSEDFYIKKNVFEELAKIQSESCILASNTSSLSITALSRSVRIAPTVVGLHFFNPAPLMRLTEIIAGFVTAPETIAWAKEFARNLGKEPVVVNEAPGFIVNRMLIPMINEAIAVLAEGVASAEDIDKAMTLGANHPLGPLALADLIGNDVNLSIMETLYTETGDPKYRAHPLLRKMVRANHLGRKTRVGFYNY